MVPTGNFNTSGSVVRRFDDGEAVSSWVVGLREGFRPDSELTEKLVAEGWLVADVTSLLECSVKPNEFFNAFQMHLSRIIVSRSIDHQVTPTIGLSVQPFSHRDGSWLHELMILNPDPKQFLCELRIIDKEADLFHGVTTVDAKPARLVLGFGSRPSQLLIKL